jgi:hypothetical protein
MEWCIEIFLQPPNRQALSFEVDFQIQQAIVALRRSSILIHGASRFGDGASTIVLKRDSNLSAALGALDRVGIRISHFVARGPTSTCQELKNSLPSLEHDQKKPTLR